MFLDSKLKKTVKIFWGIMSAIIIVSMVLLYTPLPFMQSQPVVAPEPTPIESVTTEESQEPVEEAIEFDIDA